MNTPKKSTIETIKTILLTAFVTGTICFIGGYFVSINIQGDARARVIQDIKVAAPAAETKKADQ
jgi:hypothetical protein